MVMDCKVLKEDQEEEEYEIEFFYVDLCFYGVIFLVVVIGDLIFWEMKF